MISFNPLKNKIYLDMDGVLADFDAFVFAHLGRTFLHEEGPGKDTEMWEFLITVSNMYYRLLPTSYAQELVAAARALTENVEILTAIPRRYHIHGAETDKIEWAKLHFGDSLRLTSVHILPTSGSTPSRATFWWMIDATTSKIGRRKPAVSESSTTTRTLKKHFVV